MTKKCFKSIFLACISAGLISSVCWAQGPPQPPSGEYLSSGHGQGASRAATAALGYAPGNCIHCHEQHAGVDYLKFTSEVGYAFCTNAECHSSSGSASDIKTAWELRTYSHENAIPAMGCVDCHNPHFSGPSHTPVVDGNDATQGAVKGTPVRSITWSNPGSPAEGSHQYNSPSFAPTETSVTYEYEVCLKCHSDNTYNPVTWPISPNSGSIGQLTDQGEEFNPYNQSAHPITLGPSGQWKNAFLRANYSTAFFSPWNAAVDYTLHCSDCHGGDGTTDPKGPHGSNNIYMLKATTSVESWANGPYDGLCLVCHNMANVTNFGDHPDGRGAHATALGCFACHGSNQGSFGGKAGNVHGVNYRFPQGDDRGTPVPNTGLFSQRFLAGGYLTQLYNLSVPGGNIQSDNSNKCAASDADAGINDGECSMGAKSF